MDRHLAGLAPVSLADDGSTAVVATKTALVVLDAATGDERQRITGALNAYASPGWDRLAVVFDDHIEIRPTTGAAPLWSVDLPHQPFVVTWSPDGTRLAVVSHGKVLCLSESGRALSRWPRPGLQQSAGLLPKEGWSWTRWLPDSRRLAVLCGGRFADAGGVVLVNTDDGTEFDAVELTPDPDENQHSATRRSLTSLGVSPGGDVFAEWAWDYGGSHHTDVVETGSRVDHGTGRPPCSTLWADDGTRYFVQHGGYVPELHEWVEGVGDTACTERFPGTAIAWLLAASSGGHHVLAEIQRHHRVVLRGTEGTPPMHFGAPEDHVPGRRRGARYAWGLVDTAASSLTAFIGPELSADPTRMWPAMVQPPRFSADGRHAHWVYDGLTVVTTNGDVVRLPGGGAPTAVDDSEFITAEVARWVAGRAEQSEPVGDGSGEFDVIAAPPRAVQLPRGAPADAADVAGDHLFVLDGERATMYALPD
jgi:hypothetical protein